MIPYIYDALLILMVSLLFWAGKVLHCNKVKILSVGGILAILSYTLNEGLRFGRGLDYNIYWQQYLDFSRGWDTQQNIGFNFFQSIVVSLNLPFQVLVMFMSFMFIFASLFLMKNFRAVVAYALPLWVLLTMGTVENLVRWYLAFSFVIIGMSFLLQNNNLKHKFIFVLFSFIGCTIHYAMLPVPLLLFGLYHIKKPIISPLKAIIAFSFIIVFFKTSYMLPFANLVNYLGLLSEKFNGYGENAEFWLTNNALGTTGVQIGAFEIVYSVFLVWAGYNCCKNAGRKYVFAYNLFLIGFVFRGMAKQIELLGRFDEIFFFFRAIVLACIIKMTFLKRVNYTYIVRPALIIIIIGMLFAPLRKPFYETPMKYLYVWDSSGKTPQSMLEMYLMEKYKKNPQFEEKQERNNQLQKRNK